MNRCFLVVIDSLGVGEAPDASLYGDVGANTLANVSNAVGGVDLPNMEKLGFGKITNVLNMNDFNIGTVGRLSEDSVGNDSTTGHWELAGLTTKSEFKIFENGFPLDLIQNIEKEAKCRFIGNRHASGTEIIEELGREHLETGSLILYTSGDSVFQIAAHEKVCSIETLYEICKISRKYCNQFNIGRVIARPFVGDKGSFTRTYDRKDFGMTPPGETILSLLHRNNIKTYGIGKITDLFGTEFLSNYVHTEGDEDGMKYLLDEIKNGTHQFTFANLVDLDMLYGHREDPNGYYKGLQIIDKEIGNIIKELQDNDLVIFTGDHGTDPTDGKTDHSREFVPMVAYKNNCKAKYIGDLKGFHNVASTISDFFGLENIFPGKSFLNDI